MKDLQGFKLVFEDGTEQQFDSGMLIVEDEHGLIFDSKNVHPQKQVMFTAMVLMELMDDYIEAESADIFKNAMLTLIQSIQNTLNEGAKLQ